MAFTTTHQQERNSVLGGIARAGIAVFEALARMGERSPQMRRISALSAMTDEQLAERGLKRENIVQHVLGDRFYI